MHLLFFRTISALVITLCINIQAFSDDSAERIFKHVADFPIIKDSSIFISDLRETFDLEIDESLVQEKNEKITTYKKVRLYGSNEEIYFIDYDYNSGAMAFYPWKYQLLLTKEGRLLKILSGQRFEFVNIFPKKHPFLLIVTATSKGNGGHEIYRMKSDSLENVYEGYYNYSLPTYDAHQDLAVYEPHELTIHFRDVNRDGFNDIVFSGKRVIIQKRSKGGVWYDTESIKGKKVTYSSDNPVKKIPVKFVFLYDPQSRHFRAKQDYTKKYHLND